MTRLVSGIPAKLVLRSDMVLPRLGIERGRNVVTRGKVRALAECMEGLGFRGSSTWLYAALLSNGAMTSRKLAAVSGRRLDEVMEDLALLRGRGLVGEDRDHDKTLWFALDPAFSWLSLLAERRWSEAVDLAPVTSLTTTSDRAPGDQADQMRRARTLAISLWRSAGQFGQHRTSTVRNTRQLEQLLVESISTAGRQIRAVSGSAHAVAVHALWPRIEERMAKGVTYRRLTVIDEILEHGLAVVRRDLEIGVDLRVAPEATLVRRGYLVDSAVLIQYHRDASGQTSGGQLTSDRHAIARFRTVFDRLFSSAEPALHLIDRCGAAANVRVDAARELTEDSVDLLRHLIDFGRFCRVAQERNWEGERERAARAELVASGLAVLTPHGHFLPNWSSWGVASEAPRPNLSEARPGLGEPPPLRRPTDDQEPPPGEDGGYVC